MFSIFISAICFQQKVVQYHCHFAGMTKVLVDSFAIFKKSAGLPRFTPSIALPAPRSSTHSPQLTRGNNGFCLPISRSELTDARVVGCSSCSMVVPLTGFA